MLSTLVRRFVCSGVAPTPTVMPNRPAVLWTHLPSHLPYALGLLLQESLVQRRLEARKELSLASPASPTSPLNPSLKRWSETDVLLLLEHKPVFTAGKREKDPEIAAAERERLGKMGADYMQTARGGQTTYHGPGQLVGYPLMDLGAAGLSTRCYVSHLETFLENLVSSLSVPVFPLEHTGVFTSPTTKIASIGIHIRRRISLHGFSVNVEEQTRRWFDAIVACGLADVKATSVEVVHRELGLNKERPLKVLDVVPRAVDLFSQQYGRGMQEMQAGDEFDELRSFIVDGVAGRLPELEKKNLA